MSAVLRPKKQPQGELKRTLSAVSSRPRVIAPSPTVAKSINENAGVAPSATPAPVAAPVPARAVAPSRMVLRILSGAHLGAEVPIAAERLLVGNLESECDVVLDVGRQDRHACLLRVSSDGWTVLAIAGDVWVDTEFLAAQQTKTFVHGQTITLGRIAFAVGDVASANWNAVRPPLNLVRPDADGGTPVAAALPTPPRLLKGWKSIRLAAGVGIGALVMAAGLSYLVHVMRGSVLSEREAAQQLMKVQSELAALPVAAEVRAATDAEDRAKIILTGFVSSADHVAQIDMKVKPAGAQIEHRLYAADVVERELGQRLKMIDPASIRYLGAGGFSAEADTARVAAVDAAIRAAMQEVPAVASVRLRLADVFSADGRPADVVYRRAPDSRSSILVDSAELVQRARTRYRVREIRLGTMPSVRFTDGKLYFVGSALPEGWIVDRIDPDRVALRYGDKTRVVSANAVEQQSLVK